MMDGYLSPYPGHGVQDGAEDMTVLAGAALAMTGPGVGQGLLTVTVEPEHWLAALRWACELGCSVVDRLGVDEFERDPLRCSVVAHLHCPQGRQHLLLRTPVLRQAPRLPTATGLLPGAGPHEREIRERFGVVFTGHPAPGPLIPPDGFEGRPVLASGVAEPWSGALDPGRRGPGAGRLG